MQRAIIYLLVGTGISFLINFFVFSSLGWHVDLFHAFAFGLGWAMAYFVDKPEWALPKKIAISFVGIIFLWAVGLLFFPLEIVVPSVIRFSTVFVAYYLIASFRANKSFRN